MIAFYAFLVGNVLDASHWKVKTVLYSCFSYCAMLFKEVYPLDFFPIVGRCYDFSMNPPYLPKQIDSRRALKIPSAINIPYVRRMNGLVKNRSRCGVFPVSGIFRQSSGFLVQISENWDMFGAEGWSFQFTSFVLFLSNNC